MSPRHFHKINSGPIIFFLQNEYTSTCGELLTLAFTQKHTSHTWSFSGLSERSFRLLEVRLRWAVVGLPAEVTQGQRSNTDQLLKLP